MTNKETFNNFFNSCFNSINRLEENALEAITNGTLSLKEIHFIDAVFKAKAVNENCFSTIASFLGITTGTLTTSFSKLQKKGYLIKEQDKNDKRIYHIIPTKLAELIYKEHTAFHEKLVDKITGLLSESETNALAASLKKLDDFLSEFKY